MHPWPHTLTLVADATSSDAFEGLLALRDLGGTPQILLLILLSAPWGTMFLYKRDMHAQHAQHLLSSGRWTHPVVSQTAWPSGRIRSPEDQNGIVRRFAVCKRRFGASGSCCRSLGWQQQHLLFHPFSHPPATQWPSWMCGRA